MNRILSTASIVLIVSFLAACGNRPPSCGDPETRELARKLLIDNSTKGVRTYLNAAAVQAVMEFTEQVTIELLNVVDEGYNSQTKKQLCKALVKITVPDGKTFEGSTTYSTQSTIGEGGTFVLEIDQANAFLLPLQASALHYADTRPARAKRKTSSSTTGLPGKYAGVGDGNITADVSAKQPDGKYRVKLNTEAMTAGGGFCAGSVQGSATEAAGKLRLVAEESGMRCEATLSPTPEGGLIVDEDRGCMGFHGAACAFSGTLTRSN